MGVQHAGWPRLSRLCCLKNGGRDCCSSRLDHGYSFVRQAWKYDGSASVGAQWLVGLGLLGLVIQVWSGCGGTSLVRMICRRLEVWWLYCLGISNSLGKDWWLYGGDRANDGYGGISGGGSGQDWKLEVWEDTKGNPENNFVFCSKMPSNDVLGLMDVATRKLGTLVDNSRRSC